MKITALMVILLFMQSPCQSTQHKSGDTLYVKIQSLEDIDRENFDSEISKLILQLYGIRKAEKYILEPQSRKQAEIMHSIAAKKTLSFAMILFSTHTKSNIADNNLKYVTIVETAKNDLQKIYCKTFTIPSSVIVETSHEFVAQVISGGLEKTYSTFGNMIFNNVLSIKNTYLSP